MISEHEQRELAAQRLRDRKNGGKSSTHGLVDLSAQQIRFIDEYMLDRDGAEAAIRAGYNRKAAKQAAHRLRSHPAIAAEIERRTHERARRCDVKTDDVLRELKRIAFFDVRKLFDDDGALRNVAELGEDEARALCNFDVIVLGSTGEYVTKLVPAAKLKAIELLMRHAGMLTDKKDVDHRTVMFSLDFGETDRAAV